MRGSAGYLCGRAGLDCPAGVREDLIARPGETIAGSDKLSATKGAELRGKISMLPALNRFLRVIPGGCSEWTRPRPKRWASGLVRLRKSFVTMQGWGGGR
jgi:hypothetical protein